MKWSKNKKLNYVLSDIADTLLHRRDTIDDSLGKIRQYVNEFPQEADYNLYQYGNCTISDYDIRQLYVRAGYITTNRMSDEKIRELYKKQVGYVARNII